MRTTLVELTVDGRRMLAPRGSSVAAAILNSRRGAPGAWLPVCGMGACWGCRAIIDGKPDVRSCLVPVAPGMKIRTDHELP